MRSGPRRQLESTERDGVADALRRVGPVVVVSDRADRTAKGRADGHGATEHLRPERLDQSYERLPDEGERVRFRYRSPAFDTDVELVYDRSGLAIDYPGIAVRAF